MIVDSNLILKVLRQLNNPIRNRVILRLPFQFFTSANPVSDKDVYIILPIEKRCRFSHRIDYDIQCKHELKVDQRFKLKH